jgi:hypothetical protein
VWNRHFRNDPNFSPSWGEELLYDVLVENPNEGCVAIIVGIVPTGWVEGALRNAAFQDDPAKLHTHTHC